MQENAFFSLKHAKTHTERGRNKKKIRTSGLKMHLCADLSLGLLKKLKDIKRSIVRPGSVFEIQPQLQELPLTIQVLQNKTEYGLSDKFDKF